MSNHLAVVVLMSTTAVGCVSGGGLRPEPFPRPSVPPEAVSTSASVRDSLVITATGLTGIPYQEGGNTPSGFDCSGFTRFVFAQHGVSLPRLTQEQYREGRSVTAGDVRPGDLVFFATVAPGASHVGVAITRDEFVHAPSENGVVRIERLSERYWVNSTGRRNTSMMRCCDAGTETEKVRPGGSTCDAFAWPAAGSGACGAATVLEGDHPWAVE